MTSIEGAIQNHAFVSLFFITIITLTLCAAIRFARNTVLWRRFQSFAREHDCAPAAAIRSSFLAGINHKWKRLNQRSDVFNDYMNQVFLKNGPTHAIIDTWTGRAKVIYTIEPENVKTMLSTRFTDYYRGPTMPQALNPVMGRGVFTSNGEAWAHSRSLVRAQFSGKRVKDVSKLNVHMQHVFEAIELHNGAEPGWTDSIELLLIFNRFTLDSATEFMFGTSTESHEAFMEEVKNGGKERAPKSLLGLYMTILDDFATAFDAALDYVALRLKLGNLWFLADGLTFRLACYKIKCYTDEYIRRAVAHAEAADMRDKKDKDERKFGLISDLIGSYTDKVALRNQVLQLLVAGRDTTAATLTWAFILLEAHQEVFNHLSKIVVSTFGTENAPLAPVTHENLRSCAYLQYVVLEVFRLYPTGPLNARKAFVDTVLPTGGGVDGKSPVAVQKGTSVAFNTYLMHRREELWGPDAWEFKPERWKGRKAGWEYIPFHGGPQTCLGRKLKSLLIELSFAGFPSHICSLVLVS